MRLLTLLVTAALLFLSCSSSRPQDAVSLAQQALERRNALAAIRILEALSPSEGAKPMVRKVLARAYLMLGEREIALDNLALAAAFGDISEDTRAQIRDLLKAGFPLRLSPESPQGLGLSLRELVVRTAESPVEGAQPSAVRAFLTAEALPAPEERMSDPVFGHRFQRAIYGAVMNRSSDSWVLAFRAMVQTENRLPLAKECIDLLLRLRALCQLNAPTRRLGPIDVWLCEEGKPGAQSSGSNIYILSAGTRRPPEEWIRQLCHEFGHVALPGVNHFPQPEPWSNGLMGELVFGRWLAAAVESSLAPHEWLYRQWPQDFCEQRLWPALQAALESGVPGPKDGVKAYAAFGAYAEAAFGSQILLEALPRPSPEPDALIAGLQRALASKSQTGLAIRLSSLPPKARSGLTPFLVYLPEGAWTATGGPGPARLSLDGRALDRSGGNYRVGSVKSGWHLMRIENGSGWERLVLRRLSRAPESPGK